MQFNSEEKNDLIPFSGLWKGTLKDGRGYLAAKISPGCRMVVLPNRYKTKGSNEPDYRVFFAKADSKKASEHDGGFLGQNDAYGDATGHGDVGVDDHGFTNNGDDWENTDF